MVFTRLGSVVATLALVLGVLATITGGLIGLEIAGPHDAILARYAPWLKSSGTMLEKGLSAMVIGILLGVLTEIRRALEPRLSVYERRRSEQDASY